MKYVIRRINEYIKEHKEIPEMMNPYNKRKINKVAPTITTQCGSWASSATVVIIKRRKP